MAWSRLSAEHWRYCVKVGLAAALGYLLTQGGQNQYAIFSAFTAALIVGTSVAEDLASSQNRVKGTVAGMIAGVSISMVFGPSALAVGLAVALTAVFALTLGWGVPVARIGVTLCIVTLVMHRDEAIEYDLLRMANTLIGIAVGLAVSFLVWPRRARHGLEHSSRRVLEAAGRLLDAVAASVRDLRPAQSTLYDALGALVKAGREGTLERRLRLMSERPDARGLQVLQLGLDLLAASLAEECAVPQAPPRPAFEAFRRRIEELSNAR